MNTASTERPIKKNITITNQFVFSSRVSFVMSFTEAFEVRSVDDLLPNRKKYADGDLMAIVKVVMPDGTTRQAINWNRAILIATAIITVFLAMLAAYLIVRYVIVKPLEHLRDVSDEVRRGNVDARADIHTADEFEELGVAFNRMLRGLVESQEELRKVNGSPGW